MTAETKDGAARECTNIATELIDELYAATPVPAGCRVNHAKGILVEGTFHPSILAHHLSRAAIFAGPSQPVLLRFSSSTGDVHIREDAAGANPRGLAVRIGEGTSNLVLVGHSADAFPARDAPDFLAFLRVIGRDPHDAAAIDAYVAEHPEAGRFGGMRGETPASFLQERYHMLHPYDLIDCDGLPSTGRISVVGDVPADPRRPASGAEALTEELRARLRNGHARARMLFTAPPAGVDASDVSAPWDPDAPSIELGLIEISSVVPDQSRQTTMAFNPGELVDGVTFHGDGMIADRIEAYRIAALRRTEGWTDGLDAARTGQ